MNFIGIDFGTTKSVVAIFDARRKLASVVPLGRKVIHIPTSIYNAFHIPTSIHVSANGEFRFGEDAIDEIRQDPAAYISRIKRDMGVNGRGQKRIIHGREYSAVELAAKFLGYLKEETNRIHEKVEAAVITVPALCSESQRDAIEEAGFKAGFKKVKLLEEPLAAGMAFLEEKRDTPLGDHVLVFDWGGGTLDLAVLEKRDDGFHVIDATGENDCPCGEEIDQIVSNDFLKVAGSSLCDKKPEKSESLRRKLREFKEMLSKRENFKLLWDLGSGKELNYEKDRSGFEALVKPAVNTAMTHLGKLLSRWQQTSKKQPDILLIGGTTFMPIVTREIETRFQIKPLPWDQRLNAVALGAAIKAHEIWGAQAPPPSPSEGKVPPPVLPQYRSESARSSARSPPPVPDEFRQEKIISSQPAPPPSPSEGKVPPPVLPQYRSESARSSARSPPPVPDEFRQEKIISSQPAPPPSPSEGKVPPPVPIPDKKTSSSPQWSPTVSIGGVVWAVPQGCAVFVLLVEVMVIVGVIMIAVSVCDSHPTSNQPAQAHTAPSQTPPAPVPLPTQQVKELTAQAAASATKKAAEETKARQATEEARQAQAEIKKRADFAIVLRKADEWRVGEQFAMARAAYEEAGKIWPESPDISKVEQGIAASATGEKARKISELLSQAKANDSKANGKTALAALDELLKLDVEHAEAKRLREKIWAYYVQGPRAEKPWTNSLGMKFVPAGTEGILFCVWETRVRDFRAFVEATGHNAKEGMFSFGADGGSRKNPVGYWKQRGHSWENPGFKQEEDHPVVGVNWEDATAFCKWLTEKERREGLLEAGQEYRLPTDEEWSRAVGAKKYPWGNDWPPPKNAGNYAGEETKDEDWPKDYGTIAGYEDGYARTAPVGSFKANRYGLFDMGGNVSEWCMDWYRKEMNTEEARKSNTELDNDGGGKKYRVLRGGSCFNFEPVMLTELFCSCEQPIIRLDCDGFRCVLVVARRRAQGVSEKEAALDAVNAAQAETLRRQEALITAQLYIAEADNLLGKGNYGAALKLYEDALKLLVCVPASAAEVARLHQGASICYLFLAHEAYRKEDFSSAVDLAQKSYQHDPENREALALAERVSRALNAKQTGSGQDPH